MKRQEIEVYTDAQGVVAKRMYEAKAGDRCMLISEICLMSGISETEGLGMALLLARDYIERKIGRAAVIGTYIQTYSDYKDIYLRVYGLTRHEAMPEPPPEKFDADALLSRLSPIMREKTKEWIAYKKERRSAYKPSGLKALVGQIEKNVHAFGEAAVIDLIDQSIANIYQGITWGKLRAPCKDVSNTGWDHPQRKYSEDELKNLINRPRRA